MSTAVASGSPPARTRKRPCSVWRSPVNGAKCDQSIAAAMCASLQTSADYAARRGPVHPRELIAEYLRRRQLHLRHGICTQMFPFCAPQGHTSKLTDSADSGYIYCADCQLASITIRPRGVPIANRPLCRTVMDVIFSSISIMPSRDPSNPHIRTDPSWPPEAMHGSPRVRLSKRCLISGCSGHAARLRRSMVSSS